MREFFREHSYNMVKMFLNQFATSIFGFSLALAAAKAENVVLRNVTSVFAILFYLFLLYTMTWEIGYREKIAVEGGRKKYSAWKGVLISLCANSINYLLAIFVALASIFNVPFLSTLGGIANMGILFLEGMFTGVLMNPVGGAPLNSYWFMYFVITIPSLIVCGISYQFGLHDVKFTSIFNRQQLPESDREPRQKKD